MKVTTPEIPCPCTGITINISLEQFHGGHHRGIVEQFSFASRVDGPNEKVALFCIGDVYWATDYFVAVSPSLAPSMRPFLVGYDASQCEKPEVELNRLAGCSDAFWELLSTDSAIPPNKLSNKEITLLLSSRLDWIFPSIFHSFGLNVLWSDSAEWLERAARDSEIDLAIEWQRGLQDFTVRDMLRSLGKPAPVLLALNWNNCAPNDFHKLGYADTLRVPFDLDEMSEKICRVLTPEKQEALKQCPLGEFSGW